MELKNNFVLSSEKNDGPTSLVIGRRVQENNNNIVNNTDEEREIISWTEYQMSWRCNCKQGGKYWKSLRVGRVSSSQFRAWIISWADGNKMLMYTMPGEDDQARMDRGKIREVKSKQLYTMMTGNEIMEVGCYINHKYPRLLTSPDAVVRDKNTGEIGLFEAKGPDEMYSSLADILRGTRPYIHPNGRPDHIYQAHYDQMQGEMKVSGMTTWCDYFVLDGRDNVYLERVRYNHVYWKSELKKPLLEICKKLDADGVSYIIPPMRSCT